MPMEPRCQLIVRGRIDNLRRKRTHKHTGMGTDADTDTDIDVDVDACAGTGTYCRKVRAVDQAEIRTNPVE